MEQKFEDRLEEQAETVIGLSAVVQGDVTSQASIKIEGQVEGKIITSKMITTTPKAKVTAEVEAESAIIAGEVQGHLKISGRLVLLSTAKVTADITCPILRVEEGALYAGKCHMEEKYP